MRAEFSREENDFYYGAGVQFDDEAASLQLQYTNYARDDGQELEGVQIGVIRHF